MHKIHVLIVQMDLKESISIFQLFVQTHEDFDITKKLIFFS